MILNRWGTFCCTFSAVLYLGRYSFVGFDCFGCSFTQRCYQGMVAHTKKQKYELISEKKLSTPVEVLCKDFPGEIMAQCFDLIAICLIFQSGSTSFNIHQLAGEFVTFLNYTRSLRFGDKPDYAYLRSLFRYGCPMFVVLTANPHSLLDRSLFVRLGYVYDSMFDWTIPSVRRAVLHLKQFLTLLAVIAAKAGGSSWYAGIINPTGNKDPSQIDRRIHERKGESERATKGKGAGKGAGKGK